MRRIVARRSHGRKEVIKSLRMRSEHARWRFRAPLPPPHPLNPVLPQVRLRSFQYCGLVEAVPGAAPDTVAALVGSPVVIGATDPDGERSISWRSRGGLPATPSNWQTSSLMN